MRLEGGPDKKQAEGGATELRLDHFLLHLALILPGLHKKATQVESVLALGQGILNEGHIYAAQQGVSRVDST